MKKTILIIIAIFFIKILLAQQYKTNRTYEDVYFVNSQKGWIVGDDWILNTINGGNSWDTLFFDDSYTWFGDIHFTNENTGYAVGGVGGPYDGEALILKTINSGETWNDITPANIETLHLREMFFINEETGWAVGDVIMKTTDAGETWTEQAQELNFYMFDIFFIDEHTGWAFGNQVLYTENGGETWSILNNISFNQSIYIGYFFDYNNGFAIGNWHPDDMDTHFTTTNGGETWEKHHLDITNPEFYDCDFFNSTTGWAVGDNANIAKTTDNGITWVEQECPANTLKLKGVDFINENEGWAVGHVNTIIHTTNGGETWEELIVTTKELNTKEDITIKQQNNEIIININNNYSVNYKINIHNITGVLISIKTIDSKQFIYNLSSLKTGIYILSIINNNQLITNFKIIKQ